MGPTFFKFFLSTSGFVDGIACWPHQGWLSRPWLGLRFTTTVEVSAGVASGVLDYTSDTQPIKYSSGSLCPVIYMPFAYL